MYSSRRTRMGQPIPAQISPRRYPVSGSRPLVPLRIRRKHLTRTYNGTSNRLETTYISWPPLGLRCSSRRPPQAFGLCSTPLTWRGVLVYAWPLALLTSLGRPVSMPSIRGPVLGTGFDNRYFPTDGDGRFPRTGGANRYSLDSVEEQQPRLGHPDAHFLIGTAPSSHPARPEQATHGHPQEASSVTARGGRAQTTTTRHACIRTMGFRSPWRPSWRISTISRPTSIGKKTSDCSTSTIC